MAAFQKGTSGNPAGRPKGVKDRRVKYRELIESHAAKLIKATVAKALDGDMAALRLCLERICPPIKAKDELVHIAELKGNLTSQGQTIITAMGAGTIAPSEAARMLQALAAQARIIEVDELDRRVSALEARRGKN